MDIRARSTQVDVASGSRFPWLAGAGLAALVLLGGATKAQLASRQPAQPADFFPAAKPYRAAQVTETAPEGLSSYWLELQTLILSETASVKSRLASTVGSHRTIARGTEVAGDREARYGAMGAGLAGRHAGRGRMASARATSGDFRDAPGIAGAGGSSSARLLRGGFGGLSRQGASSGARFTGQPLTRAESTRGRQAFFPSRQDLAAVFGGEGARAEASAVGQQSSPAIGAEPGLSQPLGGTGMVTNGTPNGSSTLGGSGSSSGGGSSGGSSGGGVTGGEWTRTTGKGAETKDDKSLSESAPGSGVGDAVANAVVTAALAAKEAAGSEVNRFGKKLDDLRPDPKGTGGRDGFSNVPVGDDLPILDGVDPPQEEPVTVPEGVEAASSSSPDGLTMFPDISKWVTVSDWDAVAEASRGIVVIKVMQGAQYGIDPKYEEHLRNAEARGMIVMGYAFGTDEDGAKQAQALIDTFPPKRGRIYMLDWEAARDGEWMTVEQAIDFANEIKRLTERMTGTGRYPVLYTSASQPRPGVLAKCPRYVAHWGPTEAPADADIWQFTNGNPFYPPNLFPGIGQTDINMLMIPYEELRRWAGLSPEVAANP